MQKASITANLPFTMQTSSFLKKYFLQFLYKTGSFFFTTYTNHLWWSSNREIITIFHLHKYGVVQYVVIKSNNAGSVTTLFLSIDFANTKAVLE
jgi:hypothetical protein